MNTNVFDQLHSEGFISGDSYEKIQLQRNKALVSVHWEIKTLLYLGILLFSAGLGTLVYKNIDSIGHQITLLFIALVCTGCCYYCFKNKLPFSTGKVVAPNSFFDYVLILACCTFLTFIAYLQFQYNLFGNRYGLAIFFPMLLLFFYAYYFDHAGVLSMAIVNLAAWVGITITPLQVLTSNDFNTSPVIFTGIALGIFLMIIAWATRKMSIKDHFEFTYANFGTHILLISLLAALFHFEILNIIWFLSLVISSYFLYRKAVLNSSFYFVLVIAFYVYIGTSYVVLNFLDRLSGFNEGSLYAAFFYFIISGIVLALFLIRCNKKLKETC
ncbi:MAG: hypothetical protein JWP81_756 [Ferruginibacter sp.]|nr:hypothetical protein [Ferruginibacter sp.]